MAPLDGEAQPTSLRVVPRLVLEGAFEDEAGNYAKGSWLRFPIEGRHRPVTREGCLLYAKYDALENLRSAD
jgi:anti-sigma factor ChrR (cupin superfamily)